MKFCLTNEGKSVAYQIQGIKTEVPLVLLHGFCEDHTVWDNLLPNLQASGLLCVDIPGFGGSELPERPEMTFYASAIQAVLDAENIPVCILVGHSMGGYIALEFAARWPERLAGLGLFHSHPYEDNEERKQARRRGIETLKAGKRDLYVAQLFPNLFSSQFIEQGPEIIQQLINTGKQQSPEGIASALQAMLDRRDHQSTLQALANCPVLFLLGMQDSLVPPNLGLSAAMLPVLTDLQLLQNAAHMAMFECPEESARILNTFWEFCSDKHLARP